MRQYAITIELERTDLVIAAREQINTGDFIYLEGKCQEVRKIFDQDGIPFLDVIVRGVRKVEAR